MSREAHDGGDDNAPGAAPVHGCIDSEGRLIYADPPLASLHGAAGGEEGGPMVLPGLASLAEMARQLGIAVAKPLLFAGDTHDIHVFARAWSEGEDIHFALEDWQLRQPNVPSVAGDAERRYDFLRATAAWTWQVDGALRLTALDGPDAGAGVLVGEHLTSLFRLLTDEEGNLPILDALGEHRGFSAQRAQIIDGGAEYRLAAEPLFDGKGRFRGFRGTGEVPGGATEAEAAAVAASFGERIDRALRGALERVVAGADSIHTQAEGPLRRDYADYAADIAVAGHHLLGLIDDLVDIEAVERGDFRVEARPIDLADVARRAAALLGSAAKARRIAIDCPTAEDTLPATGDYRRTLQIVVNLLSNAVRYAPEDSGVWIRLERAGDLAALVVADQGRGIATADQGRIFDKFDRLGAEEPGGSGLGLYIARQLARAMGGDIAVDSAPGQGARFTLMLPGG